MDLKIEPNKLSELPVLDAEAIPEEQKFRMLKLIIHKKSAQIGGGIALILLVMALFGNYLTPYDPFELDTINRLQAPSFSHIFGTDEHGRDIFSRILFGSKYTVQIMLITTGIATIGGVLMGLPAAYFGKWVDMIIMRVADIMLSFPYILLVLAIVAIIGPDLSNAMIAIGIAGIPSFARLTRSTILTIKQEDFVSAEKALGASDFRIMWRTIFSKHCFPPGCVRFLTHAGSGFICSSFKFYWIRGSTPSTGMGSHAGQLTYLYHNCILGCLGPWFIHFCGSAWDQSVRAMLSVMF